MVEVGTLDNASLYSQIQQSADTQNDNIPDENDVLTPEEPVEINDDKQVEKSYSTEELFNAQTALTQEIEETKSPIFKSESAFDLVKIIAATIMGEPRIKFYPVCYSEKFYAKDYVEGWRCDPKSGNKCENVFKVDLSGFNIGDKDLVNYVQNLALHNDNFTSATDYAKLIYNFGFYSLKVLTACIIKINGYGENSPLSNVVKVTFGKLSFALRDREEYFKEILGVKIKNDGEDFFTYTDKDSIHISFASCIDYIEDLYEHFCRCKDCNIELEQILIILYFSLAFYLLGCAYNLINNAMIPLKSFYDKDTSKSAADTFIDRTLGKLDAETEIKMYSLFYTFHLMTKFYENHSGIKMDDPVFMPLYSIGEKVTNMKEEYLEEKLDISELTQGDLEGYKVTFRAYLDTPSFFKDTAIYLSSLLEHDNPSKVSVALGNLSIVENINLMDGSDRIVNDPLESAISINTILSDYTDSNVEAFYNYFISIFIESIPLVISPAAYHKLTLFATTFRKIFESVKSGRTKELAALGLMQAEAYMVYLYKVWFKKGIIFKIDDTVQSYDLRIPSRTLKAKAYIQQNALLYNASVNFIGKEIKDITSIPLEIDSNHADFLQVMKLVNCDGSFTDNNYNYEQERLDNWIPLIPEDIYDEGNAFDRSVSKFDNLVKAFNKNRISFVTLFFATKNDETYNIKYISRILEADYNQKTIDTLSEYGKKTDNETVMINSSLLAKLISGNIKEIIRNNKSDERFEYYFNSFLKGMAMIFFVKDSYEHLLGNEKDSYIILDKESSESDQDHFLSLIPRVTSQRTFNFLNRR